jgi:hypothetical protein
MIAPLHQRVTTPCDCHDGFRYVSRCECRNHVSHPNCPNAHEYREKCEDCNGTGERAVEEGEE